MDTRKTEQGQVIILLVAGMITLFGFIALAIDGGNAMAEKRELQGATDSAAMTGALYIVDSGVTTLTPSLETSVIETATNSLIVNGYDPTLTGVSLSISSSQVGRLFYVDVQITYPVDLMFAKLFYGDQVNVSSHTVVKVDIGGNIGSGYAFYALADECGAINFTGSASVEVHNAGIYSASTCNEAKDGAIIFSGAASFWTDGSVDTAGSVYSKKDNWTAEGGSHQIVLPAPPMPEAPDCSHLPTNPPTIAGSGGETVYYPGKYTYEISSSGNEDLVFLPGLYCLYNGLHFNANGSVYGHDVMFYVDDGEVQMNGNSTVDLRASNDGSVVDGSGVVWDGMVFFLGYDNDDQIQINGNNTSYFEGTIFAPTDTHGNDSKCDLSGNGNTTGYNLQLICYTIEYTGNADSIIQFDDSNLFDTIPSLDLEE